MQLDRVGLPAAGSIPLLAFGPGCADVPADVPAPLDMPGSLVTRRVACNGQVFDVRLDVFGSHGTAAPVLAAVHRLAVLPNPTEDEEYRHGNRVAADPGGPAAAMAG